MSELENPMQTELIKYAKKTINLHPIRPFSSVSANSYIKVIGFVTALLVTWAGLCAI